MIKKNIQFASAATEFYFDGSTDLLEKLANGRRIIILTDDNLYAAHKRKLVAYDTIVMPAGEAYKNQLTVDEIIAQLVEFKADRQTLLVGIGGGVVTDVAGYVAAIYMRGLAVGFVPTSILAMVDAAIGGKNGIDVGIYKNIVGSIRQPEFLLFDYSLLKSLPKAEWVNGFAEVIKHAAIKDAAMFAQLKKYKLSKLKKEPALLHQLIMRNAMIKIKVVQQDEFEKGDRKLLNFGHTLGHAIENMVGLPHGHAISVGMVYAAHLSAKITGFKQSLELIQLLEQYELPTHASFNKVQAIENLMMDKKRQQDTMHFVLLHKIGKAVIKAIPVDELAEEIKGDY
jgi:3-dehydroquinate synthase